MQNSHLSQETQSLFNEAEICERKQPGRWERKKEGEEGERTEKEGDEKEGGRGGIGQRKKEGEEGERTEKEGDERKKGGEDRERNQCRATRENESCGRAMLYLKSKGAR